MKSIDERAGHPAIVLPDDVFFAEVRRQLAAGRAVTFPVRGDSMRPFLEGGRDRVVVVPSRQIRVGTVVLAWADNGRYFLHRVVAIGPGEICFLRGDGNRNGQERCVLNDIIGVASGFWRGKRFYACDGWQWRLYSWLWMRLGRMRYGVLMLSRAGCRRCRQ